MEQLKHEWGKRVPGDLKADPDRIAYWPTPFRLLNQSTKSHDFLKSIHTNLYDDISAEAHLKPSGLMAAGTFLCKDRFSDELKRRVEEIEFHKYKFRLVLRTMVVLLGTISEIEMFRNYPDKAQVAAVWRLLAECTTPKMFSSRDIELYLPRTFAGWPTLCAFVSCKGWVALHPLILKGWVRPS